MDKMNVLTLNFTPKKPRVFLQHSDTHSRVLMLSGAYSQPVQNNELYGWLERHIDMISPDVSMAISQAEQRRVGR